MYVQTSVTVDILQFIKTAFSLKFKVQLDHLDGINRIMLPYSDSKACVYKRCSYHPAIYENRIYEE
jgi:hypothetical protein